MASIGSRIAIHRVHPKTSEKMLASIEDVLETIRVSGEHHPAPLNPGGLGIELDESETFLRE